MQQISTRYNSALSLKLPWSDAANQHQVQFSITLKLLWSDAANQHQVQFSIILKTALVWSIKSAPDTI